MVFHLCFKEASRCIVVSRVNWRMFPGILKMVPKTCWILAEIANWDLLSNARFLRLATLWKKIVTFATIVRLAIFFIRTILEERWSSDLVKILRTFPCSNLSLFLKVEYWVSISRTFYKRSYFGSYFNQVCAKKGILHLSLSQTLWFL